jgi:FkbM family methyltransferase
VGLWKTIRRRIERFGINHRVEMAAALEHHGDQKCGWTISVDSLGPESVVYSFGVGTNASFEVSLIKSFGVTVHAFDPTPRAIEWVNGRALPESFRFYPWGIAAYDGVASFSPSEDAREPSYTVLERPRTADRAVEAPVCRLETIMGRLGHTRIDLLKLDIEGAEYPVLEDIIAAGIPVRQLLVEFHHRFPTVGRARTISAVKLLKDHGFRIVHLTTSGREYTLLRQKDWPGSPHPESDAARAPGVTGR